MNGLAGGEKLHKELFRYYGMSEEKIHFLPMVVDVNQFKFNPLEKEIRYVYISLRRSFHKIKTNRNNY